ncbi:MAG: cytochrome c [Nitrospirota bacterium]|nr:cytochrome c [Nitrospirota bacterium]
MKFLTALMMVLIAATTLFAHSGAVPDTGKEAYLRYCVGCHGTKGDGKGKGATLLIIKPRDFTSGTFKFKSTPLGSMPTDGDLMQTITNGLPGSAMPAYPLMPEQERKAVIVYLKTFSERWAKEVPQPAVVVPPLPDFINSPDSVTKGKDVYANNGCAVCHGDEGDGKGVTAASLEDSWGSPVKPRNFKRGVYRAGGSPVDLFRTISTGVEGAPMPSFGHLSEDDRWNLISYLLSLKGGRK